MKHNHRQHSVQGFYLRSTKKGIFLGESFGEAKSFFHTNFHDFLERNNWWIEYRYPTWLTVYCNSSQNDEEGWTRIDRSADFLRYNQAHDKDNNVV